MYLLITVGIVYILLMQFVFVCVVRPLFFAVICDAWCVRDRQVSDAVAEQDARRQARKLLV